MIPSKIEQNIGGQVKRAAVNEILLGLSSPGKVLVFLDDTGTSESLPTLTKGSQFICGVPIESASYALVDAEMRTKLSELSLSRFHAHEMVNPGHDSPWRGIDVTTRLDVFHFLFQFLWARCDAIYFCPICPESLEKIRPQVRCEELRRRPQKSLLWLVATNAMIARSARVS